MTDTDKLKRLAEDERFGGEYMPVAKTDILALIAENEALDSDLTYCSALLREFRNRPPSEALEDITDAFLAMIAENERLKVREMNLEEVGREQAVRVMREATRAKAAKDERDEAVALLREASIMHKDMHEVISEFLARIDAAE